MTSNVQPTETSKVEEASTRLIAAMTVFDVHDPEDMGTDSRVSRRFPPTNNKHRYTLRNGPRNGGVRQGVLSRFGMRHVGDRLLAYVSDRFGTEIHITDNVNRVCLTTMLAGHMEVHTARGGRGEARGTGGLVYAGDAATSLRTSDNNARLNLWLPTARIERTLQLTLGTDLRRPLEFGTAVDWANPAASSVQRLIRHLIAEVERGGPSLVSNPLALATYTDLLTHGVLHNLGHTYSARLLDAARTTTPRSIRRAEEFLQAHAAEPVRMEDAAAAAGCSLRALQVAFRRFRDTTPRAVLTSFRLEEARSDLLEGTLTVSEVAARWGFTSVARFAAAYGQRYGERPMTTRRPR